MRRFNIHPVLRRFSAYELVELISAGCADVAPFRDEQGRVVVVPNPLAFPEAKESES
jgi:hypothetical protein